MSNLSEYKPESSPNILNMACDYKSADLDDIEPN